MYIVNRPDMLNKPSRAQQGAWNQALPPEEPPKLVTAKQRRKKNAAARRRRAEEARWKRLAGPVTITYVTPKGDTPTSPPES